MKSQNIVQLEEMREFCQFPKLVKGKKILIKNFNSVSHYKFQLKNKTF